MLNYFKQFVKEISSNLFYRFVHSISIRILFVMVFIAFIIVVFSFFYSGAYTATFHVANVALLGGGTMRIDPVVIFQILITLQFLYIGVIYFTNFFRYKNYELFPVEGAIQAFILLSSIFIAVKYGFHANLLNHKTAVTRTNALWAPQVLSDTGIKRRRFYKNNGWMHLHKTFFKKGWSIQSVFLYEMQFRPDEIAFGDAAHADHLTLYAVRKNRSSGYAFTFKKQLWLFKVPSTYPDHHFLIPPLYGIGDSSMPLPLHLETNFPRFTAIHDLRVTSFTRNDIYGDWVSFYPNIYYSNYQFDWFVADKNIINGLREKTILNYSSNPRFWFDYRPIFLNLNAYWDPYVGHYDFGIKKYKSIIPMPTLSESIAKFYNVTEIAPDPHVEPTSALYPDNTLLVLYGKEVKYKNEYKYLYIFPDREPFSKHLELYRSLARNYVLNEADPGIVKSYNWTIKNKHGLRNLCFWSYNGIKYC
jgi:hypothetical protein